MSAFRVGTFLFGAMQAEKMHKCKLTEANGMVTIVMTGASLSRVG